MYIVSKHDLKINMKFLVQQSAFGFNWVQSHCSNVLGRVICEYCKNVCLVTQIFPDPLQVPVRYLF